ncbi:MAG: TolC family protein, partial [Bacteroidota bacterium]
MNPLKKSWALTLGLVAATTGAWAQETLPFEQAAKIALEQNIDLRQQQNSLLSAEATVQERMGAYTPSVNANLFGDYLLGVQFNNLTGNVVENPAQVRGGVQANYTLFNGFARQSLHMQAKHQLARQKELTKRTEQVVLFNLASQYLQVLLDQELLTIAERNLSEQQDNLRVIVAQVDAGIRPISDKYDTEAQIKNLEISVLQAENQLANDEALLIQTLQLEPGSTVALSRPLWSIESLVNQPLDLAELFDEAMRYRADYLAQKSGIESAMQGTRAAQSGYYPELGIYAYAGSRYNTSVTDTADVIIPLNQQIDQFFTSSAGFSLNIPIYSQFRNQAAVQRAKVTYENERLTLENLERTIFTEVQQATLNFETFQQSLTAAQAQLL